MPDTVCIELPERVYASLPYDYVRHIANIEVADIQPSLPLPAATLEITVTGGALYWRFGNETLRLRTSCVKGAVLGYGTHGKTRFICFTLLYGPDPTTREGTLMLTSPDDLTQWYRDFANRVALLVPGGVEDRLG